MWEPWRIRMREQGYVASKVQGGSSKQTAVWVMAEGMGLEKPEGVQGRRSVLCWWKHRRGSQVDRKIRKLREEATIFVVGSQESHIKISMPCEVSLGTTASTVTGINCCGPLAQLLSDPIQCSNLSLIELVLRYKLPIQLLQLAYAF